MPKNYILAILLLFLSSFFWSGNFLTGKLANINDLTPFKLSFFRWLLAFIILFPFTYKKIYENYNYYLKNSFILIIISVLGVTIFNSFTYVSLQTTLVINSSLMPSITPVLIIGFSWLIYKTKINLLQLLGIFLSLIGVLCIVLKGNYYNLLYLEFTKGDIWMLFAVISWALYSVLLKKIDNNLSQLANLEVMIFLGLIFIFPLYIIESSYGTFLPNDRYDYLMIVYVGLFAGILSFFAWNKGVSIIGANRASLFLHLIPVFSAIWAIFFLNEVFTLFHLLGALFIICGIILSNIGKKI